MEKVMIKKTLYLFLLLYACQAAAQIKEYDRIYDIDLNESVPLITELQREYKETKSPYNWKYDFTWDMPKQFNTDFRQTIKGFSLSEKRLENPDEEMLLRALKQVPEEFYPYIGPSLYTVKGLSGKILDLPGIKGTKNQFPPKIASVFADIPNIEFVSPAFYPYLLPQLWGEDLEVLEFPTPQKKPSSLPKIKINPEFIKKLNQKVRFEDYALTNADKPKSEGIRHYNFRKDTPLSTADVRAFAATLPDLQDFRQHNFNEMNLIYSGGLIAFQDEKKGINRDVSYLKNAVNPCQSIARKIKWSGLRLEFQNIIGKQAMGLSDWAYICERTIKAYRQISLNSANAISLRMLRSGLVYRLMSKYDFTPEERQQQRYFLEATVRMYETTEEDIKAVKPLRSDLQKKLISLGPSYGGTPIVLP
jgi:hypothetical protein